MGNQHSIAPAYGEGRPRSAYEPAEGPDYRIISKIHESDSACVYRATRKDNNLPVILKVLLENHLIGSGLARYQHECALLGCMDSQYIIKTYGLERYDSTQALVLEDFGGESLKIILDSHNFTLIESLKIAIQIIEALDEVHAAHIIHKDINPSNIVLNLETGKLKLIDFGLSTALSREQPSLANPSTLEGTLPYISPEQTGRMNRAIDYRSDFYSLGATLYELFTHQRPFNAEDPMELVHYHIAKQPMPACERDKNIPPTLSDIIGKLLAKTAEERYQSAYGIKSDLQDCLSQLENNGHINAFTLARNDIADRFQIAQKLYGRDKEIKRLLTAFDRVSQGACEIMLVAGYSGIGKTSLVREIYKPITQQRGYFISGKFDQFQRNIPYRGIISVFRELVHQLLSESEEKLTAWKEKITTALGVNGQIIVDVIPDIELIIGPQPPVQKLDSTQAQNRFNRVFQNFIKLFCQAQHPLVVYLDDLQWADRESLKLITHVISDKSMQHLFLIGAYRDNEVNASHPLVLSLEEIQKQGVDVQSITLNPLHLDHIRELIADALHVDIAQVNSLAEIVMKKTGGNPFFVEEFLKSLYAEKLLNLDRKQGRWQWDAGKIQHQGITANIVDLMTVKLKRLSNETQQALQVAACVGNQFDLLTISLVLESGKKETALLLWEAVKEGLILPVGHSYQFNASEDSGELLKLAYKFSHDRIQQAAYEQLLDDDRIVIHRKVGKLLLTNTPEEKREEIIFIIVNHFNYCRKTIIDEDEKLVIAELNLAAGKKAKASTAYEAASTYFDNGMSMLGENACNKYYKAWLALHAEIVETAYLRAQFDEVERLVEIGLKNTHELLDKIKFYEVKILSEIGQSKLRPMLKTALTVLRLLGVNLPNKPRWWHYFYFSLRLKVQMIGKSIEDLADLPEMKDPYALAAMRILPSVVTGAYWSFPQLMPLTVSAMVGLSIKYGNTPLSAFTYTSYGMYKCGAPLDMETGYRFGKLAIRILDRFNAKELRAKTIGLFNTMIRHNKEPVQVTLKSQFEAYQTGVETGDLEHAGNTILVYCINSFQSGKNLAVLSKEFDKYSEAISGLGQKGPHHVIEVYRQVTQNMMGKSQTPCLLNWDSYNIENNLSLLKEAKEGTTLHAYYSAKTYINYFLENYQEAVNYTNERAAYLGNVQASFSVVVSHFYDSLARLALHPLVNKPRQRQILKNVLENQKKMKIWSTHAPMNHVQKFYLVEAEKYRVLGKTEKAAIYYDRAIYSAHENEYINEEALAHELAAKFYISGKKEKFAIFHMSEARRLYADWGAVLKVRDIEEKYSHLLYAYGKGRYSVGASTLASLTQTNIDLKTLMKALKNISEEKIHSKILEKTMRTAIEFAGAQKGALLLRKSDNDLFIEAEGSIDSEEIELLKSIPFEESDNYSKTVINYVRRSKESLVIYNAQEPQENFSRLHAEEYIIKNNVLSILCIPFKVGSGPSAELIGLLYLENNDATNAFTDQRIETLEIICLSAAGRLELSRKAVTDSLTDLYNHEYFQNVLKKEISMSHRKGRPLSLVMIDVDHFKKFNDTWGHQAGDLVLQTVSGCLKANCRQTDVVARYGGEEFSVILPETDAQTAFDIAERFRKNIQALTVDYEGQALNVSISLGVSTLISGMDTPASFVKAADSALYSSKTQGRNRTTAS